MIDLKTLLLDADPDGSDAGGGPSPIEVLENTAPGQEPEYGAAPAPDPTTETDAGQPPEQEPLDGTEADNNSPIGKRIASITRTHKEELEAKERDYQQREIAHQREMQQLKNTVAAMQQRQMQPPKGTEDDGLPPDIQELLNHPQVGGYTRKVMQAVEAKLKPDLDRLSQLEQHFGQNEQQAQVQQAQEQIYQDLAPRLDGILSDLGITESLPSDVVDDLHNMAVMKLHDDLPRLQTLPYNYAVQEIERSYRSIMSGYSDRYGRLGRGEAAAEKAAIAQKARPGTADAPGGGITKEVDPERKAALMRDEIDPMTYLTEG